MYKGDLKCLNDSEIKCITTTESPFALAALWEGPHESQLYITWPGKQSGSDALRSHFFKVLCQTTLSAPSPVSFPPPGPKRFWLQVAILGAAHLRVRDSFRNGMK